MLALEATLALLVIAAALWLVLGPLWRGADDPEAAVYDPPDPSETKKGAALAALREIEFDKATGKLSDEDYHDLYRKYQAEALAVLRDEASETSVERLVEVHSQALAAEASGNGRVCAKCGPRPEPDAVFCSHCGDRIPGADRCQGCGMPVPAGGRFCGGCGQRVAA